MQVHIDRAACSGNASCVEIAPAVFRLDSKNKSVVLDPEAAGPEILIEAAEACPCQAIRIEDDQGKQVFP